MTVDRELIATRVAKIREQICYLTRLETLFRDAHTRSPSVASSR
jgi:hypothetical protein